MRERVSAGGRHTVGLKADGTVVATDYREADNVKYQGQCDVSGWSDIIAVSAGGGISTAHTVGLKADGTVVATEYRQWLISHDHGQCDVSGWTDIKLPD